MTKEKKLAALTVLLVVMLPVWVQCIIGVGIVAALIIATSIVSEVMEDGA